MKYNCYKCGKDFKQKVHLETHLNRKKSCQKCNISFKTNYAYINQQPIHILDYIKQYKHNITRPKLKCNKGHDLVLVNGKKRKAHFRHKNSCDTGGSPMTNWHVKWQSFFPETEVYLPKQEGQIKNRRADVLIRKYSTIIEIEHSGKTTEEIIVKCLQLGFVLDARVFSSPYYNNKDLYSLSVEFQHCDSNLCVKLSAYPYSKANSGRAQIEKMYRILLEQAQLRKLVD